MAKLTLNTFTSVEEDQEILDKQLSFLNSKREDAGFECRTIISDYRHGDEAGLFFHTKNIKYEENSNSREEHYDTLFSINVYQLRFLKSMIDTFLDNYNKNI